MYRNSCIIHFSLYKKGFNVQHHIVSFFLLIEVKSYAILNDTESFNIANPLKLVLNKVIWHNSVFFNIGDYFTN